MTEMNPVPNTASAQQRFAQLRTAFHALLVLSCGERERRLVEMAREDPVLHGELLSLLGALDESDLTPDAARDVRGLRFGPFQIEAEIGRGGMGVVYRARRVDGAFDQVVALKLLPVGARSRELAQRFLRERQILARLAHPAIARLLDGGVDAEGRPWLAMELVDGVDLSRACDERALDLDARVGLMIEVCAAVAYAHSRLIVHRDIKPANILVDTAGRPHLLDFGIARLQDDTEGAATLTGARALTPRYAAPEQIEGERATTAADVYALGVVLRELSDAAAAYPTERGRRAELARIVGKATAPGRDDRYASAAMLADDLGDWRARRPLRSGIGSRRARVAGLLRLYRWPLLSVLGVILALAGGAVLTWRQALIADREAVTARANLDALLNVLAAASPENYVGREPRASEFLVEAARRLELQSGDDALLIWRSHSQIGVGLMNLGRFAEAETLLRRAVAALERLQPRDLSRELDTLRYLVIAQRGSADVAAVRAVGDRIAATAASEGAPAGAAISALASAASTLSRLGDAGAARPWLALAERLRRANAALPAEALENYWRQRGWVALRSVDLDAASSDLVASLAVIDANSGQFSALRRAEAEWLLAEVALLKGDGADASTHLRQAEPAITAEYPAGHEERAAFALTQARALLSSGEVAQALALIEQAQPQMAVAENAKPDPAGREQLRVADAVLAQARAASGQCARPGSAIEPPPSFLVASRRLAWEQAQAATAALCGSRSH